MRVKCVFTVASLRNSFAAISPLERPAPISFSTFALAFGLARGRRVPRLVALGLVVAYIGAIPLATHGGGILTGCYWLAVGYLLTVGALERRELRPAAA